MLPYALLLDLDDTLIQYDVVADACWLEACTDCVPPGFPASVAEVLAAILRYRDWYWSDPERHRRGRLALDSVRTEMVRTALSQLGCGSAPAAAIAAAYARLRNNRIALFPGTLATLERLRDAVPKMALVANGDAEGQRAKIARFELAKYFDFVCIEGEFGFGKPDQRVYSHVLKQLGVEPGQAWMVGDNLEWDVAGPQRSGMTGIWVDVRKTGLPSDCGVRPDRIIRDLAELL